MLRQSAYRGDQAENADQAIPDHQRSRQVCHP